MRSRREFITLLGGVGALGRFLRMPSARACRGSGV
jgi:hypothetical protein